jgi:hypothetical protein
MRTSEAARGRRHRGAGRSLALRRRGGAPRADDLAETALGTARAAVRLESNECIARRVLELYEGAR